MSEMPAGGAGRHGPLAWSLQECRGKPGFLVWLLERWFVGPGIMLGPHSGEHRWRWLFHRQAGAPFFLTLLCASDGSLLHGHQDPP